MKNTIVFAAALAPLAAASLKVSPGGGAVVINYCNVEMPLQNIPATLAGVENAETSSKVLGPAGGDNKFFHPWTALNCDGGWSMKIAPNGDWSNIYQFEYTWQPDDQIWYDMSFVDGTESTLPKWKFVCPDSPTPPHSGAYQHPTDDAYGMQVPVKSSATVTLILCPENEGAAPSQAAYTSAAPSFQASSSAIVPTTTLQTSSSPTIDMNLKQAAAIVTPAPATENKDDADVQVVYEYLTVTAVVTEIASQGPKARNQRRHEHRHPHGHHL